MNAVVFDLDDTILHDDLTNSDFTVRVFRALHQKGFHIIAASGRSQFSMKPYIDQLGCVSAYVSSNGAEIWDGPSHSMISHEVFSAELSREIAVFAETHDCYAHVYEGGCFFFNRYGIWADRYAAATRLTGVYVGKLSEYIREPRNKILLIDHENRISRMYSEARVLFDNRASVTCSKPIYLEFNPLNAVKGKALVSVCRMLGILPSDTVAFGDSLNDVSMLQTAGLGIMVSNGWKEIAPYCDGQCLSNNEDGPAKYMNDHFLNGVIV